MNLNNSFYGVLYFMLFAFALSTYAFVRVHQHPILFMEMCITAISSFLYYLFIRRLDTQSLHAISLLRYKGWVMTTPLMIVALSLLLQTNVSLVYLIGLDLLMLLSGYLGELHFLSRITATFAGFIPFFLLFYALYSTATFTPFTHAIVWIYFIVWTGYGLAYLCKESTKNAVMNVLDCLAKAVVAISVSIHFISGGIV